MMTTTATAEYDDDYISLAEACRITHRTPTQVKSLAAAGRVKVESLPGCRTTFNRADLVSLAKGRSAQLVS